MTTPTRPGSGGPRSGAPLRSRTIDPAQLAERGFSLPESWLRGTLAGAEGVLGTWLALIVPALAVYIATAAAPELGTASWVESVQLGTGIWLAAHGAQPEVGDTVFTLLPLGVTLVALWLTTTAIRRAALDSWVGLGLAVGTYTAGAALLNLVAGAEGGGRGIGGAFLLALLAATIAVRRHRPKLPPALEDVLHRLRAARREWIDHHPRADALQSALTHGAVALRAGTSTAVRAVAAMGTLALLGMAVALALGMPLVLAVHSRLETDVVSTVVLGGAQLLMVPTFAIWGMAYLSGAGFTLGEGTLYSPADVVGGPLPAVPVLGALPAQEAALPALGYVYILVGLLAGWYLHRTLTRRCSGEPHWGTTLAAALTALAVVGAVVALLSALATGGFGPGRFAADVGPVPWRFLGNVAWQIASGMTAMLLMIHPGVHRLTKAGWRAASGLLGRTPA